jgi:hypothetical protein
MNGYKILEFNDISSQIEHVHKNGWDNGLYVGFPKFKEHYNMLKGSCTDWTGYPQSGKTELVLELMFNMTTFYGWKHMMYVPDIGTSIEVMAKLIHKHTGQTFFKEAPNYISVKKAFDASNYLLEHFKIIHRVGKEPIPTPIQLWDYAYEYSKENQLNSFFIDSWKDCFHDYANNGGTYATYLSNVLPYRNAIAQESGIHMHTCIHPKLPRLKDNVVQPPDYFDMEGGMQWNNSGKTIISVHRENWDNNLADVYFRKVKPEWIGRPTKIPICLEFDKVLSRYYYLSPTGNKTYARKEHELPTLNTLMPNIDFTEQTDKIPF